MKTKILFSSILMLAILAGCGGGSGGDAAPASGGGAAPPPPAAPAAPSTIVITAPAPAYTTTNIEELAAFNLLNAERGRCGFGLLAQNTHLDQAAKAHADWLLANYYQGHGEVAGTPGFTGVGPQDRFIAAGYSSAVDFGYGEGIVGQYGDDTKAGQGAAGVRLLLSAPYHALTQINDWREIGISLQNSIDAGGTNPGRQLVIDVAYKGVDGPQLPAGTDVLTYPCQGTTGTAWQLTGESPPPRPGLAANPIGQPIMVVVRQGQMVAITSAVMTVANSGAPVPLDPPVTHANDVNSEVQPNQAFLMPSSPLSPNTLYHFVVNGTNNGSSFTRDFMFSTGS